MSTPTYQALLAEYPALQDQWFPVCRSRLLKKRPLRLIRLGTPLLLFRLVDGLPVIWEDRCPHRNVPLSQGKILTMGIQCAYHGWQFNQTGACVSIPGLVDHSLCQAYQTRAFPCLELDGLIWVFMGLQKPESSSLDVETVPNGVGFIWEILLKANWLNAVENLLDATHTHFVHPGLVRFNHRRSRVQTVVYPHKAEVEVHYVETEAQQGIIAWLFDRHRSSSIARFQLPALAQLIYGQVGDTHFILNAYMTPIDLTHTQVMLSVSYVKTFWPAWISHALIQPFLWLVLQQDKHVLERQSECIADFGEEAFHSSPLDIVRATVRRLVKGEAGPTEPSIIDLLL